MVVRFGVFVPIASGSNVRSDTKYERIHRTMARLSEDEDGQDDEDHDSGRGVTFEHCGEDADNGRYKDLGRAGGGGTPRGPGRRCGCLRKLPGVTRGSSSCGARRAREGRPGASPGRGTNPGLPRVPRRPGILRPKPCAGHERVARVTGKGQGTGTRVAAGYLEGDTRVTPGSAQANPEHIARVTPG